MIKADQTLTEFERHQLIKCIHEHSPESKHITLTRLHGFLCAIISAPKHISPIHWGNYVLGEGGMNFK